MGNFPLKKFKMELERIKQLEELVFTIPTYRLSQVGNTVERYSQNFQLYGHLDLPILVFDDSTIPTSRKNMGVLEKANCENPLFYIGPEEKARFMSELKKKIKGKDETLERIFRPSYGGNRNFTIIYTLGTSFISSDDDMYPEGLKDSHKTDLSPLQMAKGRYVDRTVGGYSSFSQDIVNSFDEVLGINVSEFDLPFGERAIDSSMDLFTNTTKKNISHSTLTLEKNGRYNKNGLVVKVAQTFRTGSSDVDAKDYAEEFLRNPELLSINDMSRVFVLSAYKPFITKENWRIDCGVAGYDNSSGLPPFIPTTLRFEDYVFRLWVSKHESVASAHINSVQTHRRSPFNRQSIPNDYHNEELTLFLKDQLRERMSTVTDLTVEFEGDLDFNKLNSKGIIRKAKKLHERSLQAINKTPEKKGFFFPFANGFHNSFNRFDIRSFEKDAIDTLLREYSLLQQTMDLWPSIIEESQHIRKPIRRIK